MDNEKAGQSYIGDPNKINIDSDYYHYDEKSTQKKLKSAIVMLAIFCIAYFVAAMIATPEFGGIANMQVFGIPLVFYTGILVFVVGVVVTQMCLNQDQKS
jgi:hypothetical protein